MRSISAAAPRGGFTLVELMLVVAVIGILAAVAIAAFTRYVAKSRTAEAPLALTQLAKGSVAYYVSDHMGENGIPLPKHFPGPECSVTPPAELCEPSTVEPTPGAKECGCAGQGSACPGGGEHWYTDGVWVALAFSRPDPHTYRVTYWRNGEGTASWFGATALGDRDCDGVLARFRRWGYVNTAGDVTLTGMEIESELE